jgi:hypothetical protein
LPPAIAVCLPETQRLNMFCAREEEGGGATGQRASIDTGGNPRSGAGHRVGTDDGRGGTRAAGRGGDAVTHVRLLLIARHLET